MIITPIKMYSYKNFETKNNSPIQNTAINIVKHKQTNILSTQTLSFKGNTPNWTNGILDGYNEQIKQLQNILIEPIKDPLSSAAPIIIIYSPDKDIAQKVKQSIKTALPISVEQIKADNQNTFNQTLSHRLAMSRNRYIQNSQKSVLMIDNIEKYISTPNTNIEKLKKDFGDVFNDNDFEKIRNYGNNSENINLLKSVADYCSKLPKRETDISAATTLISMSDNPQIIDSELLRRPEKVYTIVFPPLYGEAFAKVLKDEVLKQDNFVQNIKYLPNKDIEKIDMPYNSWKNLQRIKNNSEKNPLNLKTAKIPFDVIAEFCSPDNKYGAFLAKQIPEIVQQATYKYIENPDKEFITYLLKELKNTKRTLSPQEVEREEKIRKFVEFREDINYIKDLQHVDKLLKAYKAKLVSAKKVEKLVSDIINSEILAIKNGSTPEDIYANLKYKPILDKLKSEYIVSRIDQLSENRYKFSYQDGKTDYVDLYLGSFGWKKDTLWIDSSDMKKVELTKHFINEIKSLEEFKKVKIIEFPTDKKPENNSYKPTGRITIDKKPIYYIKLENSQTSEQGGLE